MSSCKIVLKLDKPFGRYCDFSIIKMATIRHIGYLGFCIKNQDGGHPPFCICGANFGTTHNLVDLSLCKIWLKSLQSFSLYKSLNIL